MWVSTETIYQSRVLLRRRPRRGADGPRRVGHVAGRVGAPHGREHVVARVSYGGQQVAAEVELAAGHPRQPRQQLDERLLRRVGGVLARAGDPVGEVERAPLVAVVELRERRAVAGHGGSRERLVVGCRQHATDGTAAGTRGGVRDVTQPSWRDRRRGRHRRGPVPQDG